MIFAWWKCWPYCESILTASHSEVVRQWDKFTTEADKAASIMCGTTNNRKINEYQWEYLRVGWLQAQQCTAGLAWVTKVLGTARWAWGGLVPDVAELGVCAETQGRFQSLSVRSLLEQRGSGKTCFFFFKWWSFSHSKKVGHKLILVKVPQYMHLLVIPVFHSGGRELKNSQWNILI